MKHSCYQKYVYKIHSSKIIKSKMNYIKSLEEMRRNQEIIALADSEVLRFVDEINGVDREAIERQIKLLRSEIKQLQVKSKSASASELAKIKATIKKNYAVIDEIQIKPDYLTVVMDKDNHIEVLEKGFCVNGRKYKRLVGTPNGVKCSTVVYSTETTLDGREMYAELQRRLDNGRDVAQKFNPAKFEAYKALACSSSEIISYPNSILVVDDVVLHFNADVLKLDDEFADERQHIEPVATHKEMEVELDANDGFGLITPELAQRWSDELGLDYLMSGCCIRNSFVKGMVFPFDFREFARDIAHTETVKDVWGREFNINDVELILPTSMFKLWQSYTGIDDYLANCHKNNYHFATTKICPDALDEERTLNYQFIQSYRLTDEQIGELIAPTVNEIKETICGNIDAATLFLRGTGITEKTAELCDENYIKAVSIEPKMFEDSYVIDRIHSMLKRRIKDAKIGVVKVEGNYSIISGDPYALCQHIFKTNVDSSGNDIESEMGLISANEIYSRFWLDKGVSKVACFRAPMSCHNNIRVAGICQNCKAEYWYRYMRTATILNCHDAMSHSLNGCDFDADILFTSNNKILVDNWRYTPAIVCVQRSAAKYVINDDLLRQSNKNGFGDEIGVTTNHITAMFDVQAIFEPDSKEYQELDYRIQCGQLYQQAAIDRVKGIIANPMPKYWFTKQSEKQCETEEELQRVRYENSICAPLKPYFMIYIYPQQKKKYDEYMSRVRARCLMLFGIPLEKLEESVEFTPEQFEFLEWYHKMLPVSDNGCVMNRLCHIVEDNFKGLVQDLKKTSSFDTSIIKVGVEYSRKNYNTIKEICSDYMQELERNVAKVKSSHVNQKDNQLFHAMLLKTYKEKCAIACPNEDELCDILIDICYGSTKSKQFVWDMCGDHIVENLLKKNNGVMTYLEKDADGEVVYRGERFTRKQKKVRNVDEAVT